MTVARGILIGAALVVPVSAIAAALGGCALWISRSLGEPWTWLSAWAAIALVGACTWTLLLAQRRNACARLAAALEQSDGSPLECGSTPFWLDPISDAALGWRRRAEDTHADLKARLREAEIRLSISEAERRHSGSILHSLRDAVIVTDPFNELTLANEPAAKLLGFEPGAASHRPIDELIQDETLRKLIKDVRKSGVVAKQKRLEHVLHPSSQDDQRRGASGGHAFDVTITCLPDAKQDVGGVVTILRDITREKEISQMKSDFVSQASHELRTPLASINAYVEMLLDEEAHDEPTRKEFYSIIKGEVDRVSRMIDNMLNISRIEAGIVSVDRSQVDLAKLVRGVLEAMSPQAKPKNIMLVDKIGPLMYTAEADRDMIHQVVMNLVSNAIKYTPEGGRVTVSVENDDASHGVLVSVQDTGLGIPPDALPRLFEKFYRIENYKRMAKGTGLGLNLVKHIIETVHRGQVGVSSQVGMGSRFWFTLPYEFQGG